MLRKGHILIVETDDLIRQLLEQWLGEAGYVVQTGASQESNTHGALVSTPDLIIVNVPDPRDAQALIGSVQVRHDAPILVVSARFRRGLWSSVAAARRIGARKVLPKPFTREELLAAVEESIGGSSEAPS
jgi:DNA-binding response OmpR family regulator